MRVCESQFSVKTFKMEEEKEKIIPVKNNKLKQRSSSDDPNDHIITFN